jgi:hypothetical protein
MYEYLTGSDTAFDAHFNTYVSTLADLHTHNDTEDMEAWFEYLYGFYIEDPGALSKGAWDERREAFYDMYDVDPRTIDWDAYREAIHELFPDTPL